MRVNDKIIYGYVVLSAAFVAFIVAVLLGTFELGLIFMLLGLIIWLIISHIGGSEGLEGHIGTLLLVSGSVIGLAALFGLGFVKNIIGDYKIDTLGLMQALCLWLLIGGLGLVYRALYGLKKKLNYLHSELKKFYKSGTQEK